MGANPSRHSSGEELAGSTHHQRSRIFQVKSQPSWESITAKTLREAKSTTEMRASLPAPRAPIQQVQRSRNPPGKDGNGSWAKPLGRSQCQTIPLPEESGAKAAHVKAGGCRSKPSTADEAPALACRGSVPAASKGCSTGTATASRSDRPRSAPRASPAAASRGDTPLRREPSPRTGEAESSLRKPRLPDPQASPCGAASRSWEREEKPLGITAPPGMPGGRIPPPTPTPGAVTSQLSSPMP